MLETEQKKEVTIAESEKELADCFLVYRELRPQIESERVFVEQMLRQKKEGFVLVYFKEGNEIASCMGFRIYETFGWGKILYIDDLITRAKSRRKGFARALLDYAKVQARKQNCNEMHLDSGHHRFDAHRLYLNFGFKITCHHFAMQVQEKA
jgi:GNAT superfamily N-acetyltransferase